MRGHCVMAGYYNNPEATARAIDADGWLHTGDLARRRADGNYRIVGRSKELIIRGGENIYPARGRGVPPPSPGGGRGRRGRAPRCPVRRGRRGLGRDPGRATSVTPDDLKQLLPGTDRPLQDPAIHHDRREPPPDRDRARSASTSSRRTRSASWAWPMRHGSRQRDSSLPPDDLCAARVLGNSLSLHRITVSRSFRSSLRRR